MLRSIHLALWALAAGLVLASCGSGDDAGLLAAQRASTQGQWAVTAGAGLRTRRPLAQSALPRSTSHAADSHAADHRPPGAG